MKSQLVVNYNSSISKVSTSHNIGRKEILIEKDQCDSPLMQAAKGTLLRGEKVPLHMHPTMEEFFHIINGEINFVISKKSYLLTKGDFIKIPADSFHSLKCLNDAEFIYYGIRTN